MEDVKTLKETLCYKNENAFNKISDEELDRSAAYAEAYKMYLDLAKTEREAVTYSISLAESAGFVEYKLGDSIVPGGKYYLNNRGKALFLFKCGTDSPEKGIYISAAHIDAPRLDLKPNPLYEDSGMGFMKTHYYGGVKKYQWTAIPLALHGVVVKSDGSIVDVCIGEDEDDPVLYIDDLLIHLSKDQMQKTLAEAIPAESLNLLVGSEPYKIDTDSPTCLNILNILNTKYGITEEDFLSSELTAVPAFKARDVGLDRSFIGAYAHDDRVCSYAALAALFDSTNTEKNVMVILADKEEIGSEGVTGMRCAIFDHLLEEIAIARNANIRKVKAASKCLSADVTAAYDPNFAEVYEKRNSAFVNCGTAIAKYTGARGKSSTSDATAELVGYIRKLLNDAGVVWQIAEMGKADQGGGGTVAMYIANRNIDTIDIGVPVLSMHAPFEVVSKLDAYMTYKAFLAFNN